MSLQIPIPVSSPSVPRPQPHSPLLNTYDTIIPAFSIGSLSLAIAASIRASRLNLNILFLLPSESSSWEDILAQDIGGSFLEDLATGIDPTSKYTYLNFLAEEGKLAGWMSMGQEGMRPRGNEWKEYIKWCAEAMVKESEMGVGGVQFLMGDLEGMRERRNRRGVDVFVRLNGGEEVVIRGCRVMCAGQEEANLMMEVLESVKRACEGAGQNELNLATMARESDNLLSKWEKEEERRMLRAVL
ncbi:hypothetical protein ACMFMG_003728 [Clarireedia jacksonii]